MNKLPVVLGSTVGFLALYVGVLSFNVSMDVNKLESLVLPLIKNVESAKFSVPRFAKNNKIACMEWNSKDGAGAYQSLKTASFSNTESGWVLNKLESSGCDLAIKTSNTRI